ncbi:multidrug effflux MFS transporter [Corynebacterium lubricantis]|uniref:multidrug effflux MFS transporter n=1 Tax=Corynebacterium lubricantis TaxID=541095 RepID=UPI00036C86C6|nr:multidrug effflux MFS transporter [Corynebacterium lubricantis]
MVQSKSPNGISTPILISLALCSGYAPFAIDTYLVGMPAITDEFQTTASLTQFTLTGFLLALGLSQLIIGPLSDSVGRRKLLLGGLLGAVIASVVCALAPNIWVLILGRVLQGAFGAAGVVLSRAIVGDLGRGIGIARAFALLMSIQSLAPLLAPIIGGLLIPSFGWRSAFWFLVGLGVVSFFLVLALVAESLPPEERTSGGAANTVKDINSILRTRDYIFPLIVFVGSFAMMFAYIAASPFVLQRIGGLSESAYTIVFTINSFVILIMNMVSRSLVPKYGPQKLISVGVLLGFIAVVWLFIGVVFLSSAPEAIIPGFMFVVASSGLILPNASAIAVEASGDKRGTGSALLGAFQFGLAAIVSPLTGIGNGTTAMPMIIIMGIAIIVQILALTQIRKMPS